MEADRDRNNSTVELDEGEVYEYGPIKPVNDSYRWTPVRGLDPTKGTNIISGWRGTPITSGGEHGSLEEAGGDPDWRRAADPDDLAEERALRDERRTKWVEQRRRRGKSLVVQPDEDEV